MVIKKYIVYISATLFLLYSFISLAASNNDELFDASLVQSLNNIGFAGKNWFISPASIKSVLEELYIATGGKTKKQLESVLAVSNEADIAMEQSELKESPEEGVVWKTANRILVKDSFPLKESYKSQISSLFQAQVENTDFANSQQTANSINSWVSNSTEGLIDHLVQPDDVGSSSLMVLLNAVYFKGTWKYSFKEKATSERCFYNKPAKCSKTDMMRQRGLYKYGDHKELGAKVLQLPYSDIRYTMVLLLPDKYDGLTDVVNKLPESKLMEFIKSLKYENIRIIMPKFKTKFKIKLNEPLQKIGLKSIFEDTADFSSMTDASGVYVSDVIHEAQIAVSEKGTIAAASTGVVMTRNLDSEPPDYVIFNADHPFLYFILYNTQVLFTGQYYG